MGWSYGLDMVEISRVSTERILESWHWKLRSRRWESGPTRNAGDLARPSNGDHRPPRLFVFRPIEKPDGSDGLRAALGEDVADRLHLEPADDTLQRRPGDQGLPVRRVLLQPLRDLDHVADD